MPSIPSNIPPIENLEDVRRVLSSLITSINSVLVSLPSTTFNGQRLTRIGLPVSQDDAATKGYVDSANSTISTGTSTSPTSAIAVNIVPRSNGHGLIPSAIVDDGTEVYISSSRKVGIGVSSPASALTVSAATDHVVNFRGDPASFGMPAGLLGIILQGVNSAQSATEAIVLFGVPVAVMGGMLGVGTTSPSYETDVVGDCNVSGVFRVGGTPGQTTTVPFVKTVTVTGTGTTLNVTSTMGTLTFSGGIETAHS